MAKYIEADLLRKDIDNWKEAMADAIGEYSDGVRFALEHFTFVLDSLQQKQTDFPITDEQIKEFLATHPKIEVPEKYKNPDWLFKKQELPEVDFEIGKYMTTHLLKKRNHLTGIFHLTQKDYATIASHFYELGKNSK